MILEASRQLVLTVKDYLKNSFNEYKLTPSVYGDIEKYACTPTMIFTGPTIQEREITFERKNELLRVNDEGTKIFGQKRWWIHIDLLFNVKIFFTSLLTGLPLIEKANTLRCGVESIIIGNEEFAVCFDDDFRDDITVNFSDIKHYETTCRVEDLVIRKDGYDKEVKELKNINYEWSVK